LWAENVAIAIAIKFKAFQVDNKIIRLT